MSRSLLLVLAMTSGPAIAACPAGESEVFSCLTDTAKEVRVCQGAQAITYRYGSAGKAPELTMSEANHSFEWEHGEAPSAGILDYLTFNNGATRYVIEHQSAYGDPSDASAHLTVSHGTNLSIVECASQLRFTPKAIKAEAKEISEGAAPL